MQVRAIIVQLGFFTHMLQAVGAASGAGAAAASGWAALLGALTPSVMFVIGFMLFFSIVIALFKVRLRLRRMCAHIWWWGWG